VSLTTGSGSDYGCHESVMFVRAAIDNLLTLL
jgi:hypothetical protein